MSSHQSTSLSAGSNPSSPETCPNRSSLHRAPALLNCCLQLCSVPYMLLPALMLVSVFSYFSHIFSSKNNLSRNTYSLLLASVWRVLIRGKSQVPTSLLSLLPHSDLCLGKQTLRMEICLDQSMKSPTEARCSLG